MYFRMKFALFFRFFDSWYILMKYLLTETLRKQYVLWTRDCRLSTCGPETVDRRGSTKHTAFPRSQSISILLYTKSQRNEKIKLTSYENT